MHNMRIPAIEHNAPASGLIKYYLGTLWMLLTGWEVTGNLPPDKKFVLIGAHHTSNWDFPFGMAATFVKRIKTSWMGKDVLFKGPLGIIMRALGGIPIDRASENGVVAQMVQEFNKTEKLVILMAADGTRKKTDHWRSGFYWIAHGARVPIVCGYLDYKHKSAHFGLSFIPTGNIKEDMDRVREFYKHAHGRYPELETMVRLEHEGD